MEKVCYNCGIQLNKTTATVEHVPAKNLYDGFGSDYKKNRITVPACSSCNNLYSKIDQEIRDALAIKNDDVSQREELTGKGIRSILRKSNWLDRAHFNNTGQVIAVDFDYGDLLQLHIKNFKALFFRKYSFPLPDHFEIDIISEGDYDKLEVAKDLYEYAILDTKFECSGHPDVFKFTLKDITHNKTDGSIYESGDFNKLIMIIGILIYHNDIIAIVVAGKKDFLKKFKEN